MAVIFEQALVQQFRSSRSAACAVRGHFGNMWGIVQATRYVFIPRLDKVRPPREFIFPFARCIARLKQVRALRAPTHH